MRRLGLKDLDGMMGHFQRRKTRILIVKNRRHTEDRKWNWHREFVMRKLQLISSIQLGQSIRFFCHIVHQIDWIVLCAMDKSWVSKLGFYFNVFVLSQSTHIISQGSRSSRSFDNSLHLRMHSLNPFNWNNFKTIHLNWNKIAVTDNVSNYLANYPIAICEKTLPPHSHPLPFDRAPPAIRHWI